MERIWSPWRHSYVTRAEESPGCVFCIARTIADGQQLIVHEGALAYVILNKFPYNAGHLMVVPYRQVANLDELTDDEALELMQFSRRCLRALRSVMKPQGFNVGFNLGKCAGAGIVEHLHLHIVPRWEGDTNFMPVVANSRVLPEALKETAAKLRVELATQPVR